MLAIMAPDRRMLVPILLLSIGVGACFALAAWERVLAHLSERLGAAGN